MASRKAHPYYCNETGAADFLEGRNDNWEPVLEELVFDKWQKITTDYEYCEEFCKVMGGQVNNLILMPEWDIQADLLYDGEIECCDHSSRLVGNNDVSFPFQNVLFHSTNLEKRTRNHYRFTTKYTSAYGYNFANLERATELSGKEINQLVACVFPLAKKQEDIIDRLLAIFESVRRSLRFGPSFGRFHNFEDLFINYLETNRVNADSRAVATFTAGLIESFGMQGRTVRGGVNYAVPGLRYYNGKPFKYDKAIHCWAEAYVPFTTGDNGIWVPIDPLFSVFEEFPYNKSPFKFALNEVELPVFKNPKEKSAYVKFSYV